MTSYRACKSVTVSTHSRLKAAGKIGREWKCFRLVSTHSRLKAAGRHIHNHISKSHRFNTQPPKGGWLSTAFLN